MITTRTPLRISFFGGGTDYPIWYREFGGAVLSTAIDKCCYITCRRLPPFFEYHSRVSYSRIENVTQNDAFEHPSVRACLKYLGMDEGVEIHHVADLPARTGLGTSSAFTVGLLLALYALKDQMRNKHALATDALEVEQEVIREAVGSQDQISAAYGGFNRINFNMDGSFEVKPVLTSPDRLAALQQHCALYFTGFSRTAYEFGHLLHEGWQVKRTLTQKITNTNLDEIYEAGRSAGALGGKLLGAGGGGFMLFFVPPERRNELRMRLKNLLCVPMKFSNRGSHVVVYEPEEVYDESLTAERSEVYAQQPRPGVN